MNNTHSNKEDYTPSNKVISRKTKTKRESRSFKQKGGAFGDDFNGLDITGSNYCWLAASIQLLWSIKPLRDFLLTSNLHNIIINKNINTKEDDERIFYEALDFYENNNNESEPDIFPSIDESPTSFKRKHSNNFKNIILALSRVFQLYQENITIKTAEAIQISDEVLFKSVDGTDKKVMEILELAGQEADTDKTPGKQRDSEEFLAYIFNLFGMSNNNELMKTISYYSKTYHTTTKQDRIKAFNEYLEHVKSYEYKIIGYDTKTATAKITIYSAEDIERIISNAEKLINKKEIDEIDALVNKLTKENEDEPVTTNKEIIQDIKTKIFKSITGNTDPKILEELIVNKKREPYAMEGTIGLLLRNNKSMHSITRTKLNDLRKLVMKKYAILTLLEKYNDISLLTRKYQFEINTVLLVEPVTPNKEHTMQELVTSYETTSHITVPIESKYILIKRSDETIMNKDITAHKNINIGIGNISYKLCGCISYTGKKTHGHYFYIAFQEGDSFLKLNDSNKTLVLKTETNYENELKEINNNACLYLYEKEEVLVNATEEDFAASTLVLVATAILTEPELNAQAEAKKQARAAEKEKKEKLDKEIKAAIEAEIEAENSTQKEATKIQQQQQQQEQEAAAERNRVAAAERNRSEQEAAERTRLQQEQEAAERNRVAAGITKRRPAPTGTGDIDEDRVGDNVPPTDPYRYAESSDYGSSAENIVLGTLLCITIIISTVMLSK